MLFGLQISIFLSYINDARTVLDIRSSLLTLGKIQTGLVLLSLNRSLMGVQVVVTDDYGAGVTPVQVFQQLSHRSLLLSRSRISGLTADVQTTLVAYTYRVFVVVLAFYMAVGANHPFRSAGLNLSVTTDDVVVADAELEASVSMPRIYISGG
jgi:hypothetical protein